MGCWQRKLERDPHLSVLRIEENAHAVVADVRNALVSVSSLRRSGVGERRCFAVNKKRAVEEVEAGGRGSKS